MTMEHPMCPPPSRRRLTREMLTEVEQRLNELRHMAAFAGELSMELAGGEDDHDVRFHIAPDRGDRLAFCVLNVESRIDDRIEFVRGVA